MASTWMPSTKPWHACARSRCRAPEPCSGGHPSGRNRAGVAPMTREGGGASCFSHDAVEIAFLDEGRGEPIVLVHGFASTAQVNWVHPGWVATLTRAGRRVIALDNRGHGASTKLYDPAAYHSARMAEDIRALLDHLELGRADVMGWKQIGTRIARSRSNRSFCDRYLEVDD